MPGPDRSLNLIVLFGATLFWVLATALLLFDIRTTYQRKAEEPEARRIAANIAKLPDLLKRPQY